MMEFTKEELEDLAKSGTVKRAKKPAKRPSAVVPVEKRPPAVQRSPETAEALKMAAAAHATSASTAQVVAGLATAMEKVIKAGETRKPHPYRFEIIRDSKGRMESVTATPMGKME